MQGENVRNCIL